tara:strand:+ start:7771 stop:9927 length:2157 start_codon:yes stop_codon:yes gene_type:complete
LSVIATIKKIKYLNEITDWCVIQFIGEDGATFIGSGKLGPQYPGYRLRLMGNWKPNPRGAGKVLDVVQYQVMPPKSEEGIYLFLTSGLFEGMTRAIAKKLVDEYGSRTLDLLTYDINILNTVKGVGAKRFIKIRDSFQKTIPQQERVFKLINDYQFTFTEALLVVKQFPENTIPMLEKAPYSMYRKLHKIPFVRFDRIIMASGFNPEDKQRIREVILHQMKGGYRFGHTLMRYGDVLSESIAYLQLDRYVIEQEINWLISKRRLHCCKHENDWVLQTMWFYAAEKEIATRLSLIDQTPPEKQLVFNDEHPALENLKPHQRRAVVAPFLDKVTIVTGRPGAGKTTLLRTMLQLIEEQNLTVLAVSPTGKAAQRLREVTNKDCSTIHRALGATHESDEFIYNDLNPLDVDVVVVDETSMLDTSLLRALLRATPYTARIILIGDVEQLPSVGAGAVYRDLIDSMRFPTYWMTQVLRITKADGSLPTPLHMSNGVREGQWYDVPNDEEWSYYPTRNNAETMERVKSIIADLQQQGLTEHDVQVFAPMNEDEMGVNKLNTLVKSCFFPGGTHEIEAGDKIMQRENNYDLGIYNGDIGVVKEIYPDEDRLTQDDPVMQADMTGRMVEFTKREMYHVTLAYAITGHKSQGSEYPHVIIVIPDHHISIMDRFWLYTLITRCQVKAHVVGNEKVIKTTVRSRRSHERKTMLKEQLARFLPMTDKIYK